MATENRGQQSRWKFIMSMELGEQEQNVIGALVRLFKNQGEILLCDEGKLTLPASALVVVNRAFQTIRNTDDFESSFEATPANTEKLPHLHQVQMLFDFVQKLCRLKIPHHYHSLPGHINVAAFRALRHLELTRLPLHLVSGLANICSHLETIACTKCLSSLKELFEDCGGDKSSPLSWSNLQAVYIRENRITGLDTSLRLVPIVKVLDLSHNSVEDTMNYLEYLTELTMLNFNFNKLYKIPSLSVSCKTRLQVLLLRYNRLSQLGGVEELTNLQELDVRGNLIASHTLLLTLKPLTKLNQLHLAENPLCYHKNHRCMTVQYVNPMAVRKVVLDGRRFNKKELKYTDTSVPTIYTRPTFNHLVENNTDLEQSIEQSLTYDASYSATTPTASEAEIKVTSIKVSKKKRGGRKGKSLRRARKADISDMDSVNQDTLSVDSFKVSSYVEEGGKELRDHMETMRNQLGPDWLQTLDQQTATTVDSLGSVGSDWESQGSVSRRSHSPGVKYTDAPSVLEQGTEGEQLAADNLASLVTITAPEVADRGLKSRSPAAQLSNPRPQSSSDQMLWRSEGSESNLVDYGAESEPFIVSNYDDPEETYIVTVADRFVLEKNIDGVVMEALDLKCLLDVASYEDSLPSDDDTGAVVYCAKLLFNYVNRSKRERKLIMEDEQAAQNLCDLLRSTVENNQQSAKLKDRLQCLKCGKQFSKHSAKRHVRKSSYGGISKSGSIGQNIEVMAPLLAEKGTLEEALKCPVCSSDMIIEVDTNTQNTQQTNSNKPGSQLPFEGYTTGPLLPLATSSALTSPRKQHVGTGVPIPNLNSPQLVTESSYKSCGTELSTSYKSIKEAVLKANLSKPPVLSQETDSAEINVSDIYVEEPYMSRNPPSGLRRNEESFKSVVSSNDSQTINRTKDGTLRRNEESFQSVLSSNDSTSEQQKVAENATESTSITVINSAIANNNVQTNSKVNKNYVPNNFENESETQGISHTKASDTLAWVQHSSEGLSLLPVKSNSSTGVITRVSESDLDSKRGSRSNTDINSGRNRSNMYLSQVREGSEVEFLTSTSRLPRQHVLRHSGSDLVVIDNPSDTNTQNETETSWNTRHSEHFYSVTADDTNNQLRKSGSDLLVLKNPSKENVTSNLKMETESETVGNPQFVNDNKSSGVSGRHLNSLVTEFGQVSMSGQLSRLPTKGLVSSSGGQQGGNLDNSGLDISESDSESGLTNSGSFHTAVTSAKKTGHNNKSTSQDSRSNNPFFESNEQLSENELDETNPFYEGSKTTVLVKKLGRSDDKSAFVSDRNNKEGDKNNHFIKKGKGSRKTKLINNNNTNKTNVYDGDIQVIDRNHSKDFHTNSKLPNYSAQNKNNTKPDSDKHKHSGNDDSSPNSKKSNSPPANQTSDRLRRLSSDIEVLPDESTSPTVQIQVKNESETLGIPQLSSECQRVAELSPVGSLTTRTVTDMVDFMRSSIYDTSVNSQDLDQTQFKDNISAARDKKSSEELINYDSEDFSKIDHRLKLYLMMQIFGAGEEFHLLLKCGVIQYTKTDEVPGLMVVSNLKLYVFKVSSKENPDHIEKWLKLLHSQPITELQYVDIGLGYQSFRLELGFEATCFDCIIRDELRCKTFVAQFTALLQGLSFSSRSQLEGISKSNPDSLENLTNQVFLYSTDSQPLDPVEVDTQMVAFLKGYLHTSKKEHSPVSIAISNSHVCLASENHKFPLPRCSAEKVKDQGHTEVKGQQFNYKDRQRVTDLTRVELHPVTPTQLTLYFMDDSSTDECKWLISMATRRSVMSLISALNSVWTQHFGVELQVDEKVVI